MTYLSVNDVKTTHSITSSFSDAAITRALNASCEAVNVLCGRPMGFLPSSAGVVRYYTPADPRKVVIDDLITLTELVTSDLGNGTFSRAWTLNSDFVLTPLNNPAIGYPYTRIEINPWGATVGFPSWAPRSVRVTGTWGWSATPAGVVEAASLLTNRLLQRDKSAPLGVQFNADMALRIAYSDSDVTNLLKPFVREQL